MTVLTNTAIEALLIGGEIKDDRVPGLSARRHASGFSFMLYYRTKAGIPRRPKIGAYPLLSIAVARDIARSMLAQVAAGKDPVAERQIARGEPDVDALWARCEREHYNRGRGWDSEAKRLYQTNAKPRLGHLRVRSVDYDVIAKLHADMWETPFEANRTLAVISKMLTMAERWKWRDVGSSPCRLIPRYKEESRRRFAKPDELGRIGAALDKHAAAEPEGVAFLYLLMFSGARPSEIENGTPDMIERVERDGQVFGVLRLPEGKTGRRDVFLPPAAMAVIAKLPANRKSLAGTARLPRELWETVRTEAGCPDLWARDLRRTFGTVALSNGISLSQVGELLGHKSAQTTKIYARLMEDTAHTAAANVAERIQAALGGSK